MTDLFAFVFTYIGAVAWWLLKGLTSNLDIELSRMRDRDFKFFRNLLTGLMVFAIFLLALNWFL